MGDFVSRWLEDKFTSELRNGLPPAVVRVRRAACILFWSTVLGCGGAATGSQGARSQLVPRETELVHEDCDVDEEDVVVSDVDRDGRAELRTVRENARPVCRSVDFNFDGVVDVWLYWDESGKLRRKESDYDRDGRVDEIALYRGGVLAERHRATTLVGRLDTWQFYDAGKVVRTERDSNGDRYVDQWWEYPDGRALECPLVHSDVDGDGHPDPGATVDVCSDGVPIPEAPPAKETEARKAADGIPVETNSSELPVEQPQDTAQDGESAGEKSDEPAEDATEGADEDFDSEEE